MKSHRLKLLLIKTGVKNHECECCGLNEWNKKPIPIELHHIDGNNKNNEIENLMIVCPNCHAQTDNYKSKNRSTTKHGATLTDEQICEAINSSYYITEVLTKLVATTRTLYLRNRCKDLILNGQAALLKKEKRQEPQQKRNRIKTQKYCLSCHCELQSNKKTIKFCMACYRKEQKKHIPAFEELKEKIIKLGYVKTAIQYGVSDNAVRKWVMGYGEDPSEIKKSKD